MPISQRCDVWGRYLVRLEEMRQSAKIMRLTLRFSDDEIVETVRELAERNGYREDIYIRPMVYKSSEVVGVRMRHRN